MISRTMAPIECCADVCAITVFVMFSDLTRKVTMQNLYNVGGFSVWYESP
jgi:enoyl-[acyl-carrier protein] reductase I